MLALLDEHYVARLDTADEGERAPVPRPVEGDDLLGLEVGELLRRTPIERLEPDVRQTAGVVGESN